MSFTIPDDEIEFRASRSGGPGGQHVNKTSTRIEARWNVYASGVLSDHQRTVLLERLKTRIDASGDLRVVSGARRSQRQNRDAAVERLNKLVAQALVPRKKRKPTKPSKAVRERRLRDKRHRAKKKKERRQPPQEE